MPTKLRPFDECDWYGFAGVDTSNPEIAECPAEIDGDRQAQAVVILDGSKIGVEIFSENADSTVGPGGLSFMGEYGSVGRARDAAETLLATGLVTRERLREFGLAQVR